MRLVRKKLELNMIVSIAGASGNILYRISDILANGNVRVTNLFHPQNPMHLSFYRDEQVDPTCLIPFWIQPDDFIFDRIEQTAYRIEKICEVMGSAPKPEFDLRVVVTRNGFQEALRYEALGGGYRHEVLLRDVALIEHQKTTGKW